MLMVDVHIRMAMYIQLHTYRRTAVFTYSSSHLRVQSYREQLYAGAAASYEGNIG